MSTHDDDSIMTAVLTYDGRKAFERPRVVIWEGIEHEVTRSVSLYISTGLASDAPVKRGFHVRCRGGRQFKLELTEGAGWKIEPIPGPHLSDGSSG